MSKLFKPEGHLAAPLIIFSFVALLLGAVSELMGNFDGLNDGLREVWVANRLDIQSELGLPGPVGIIITAALVFGLVAGILQTPGSLRRSVLGITAVLLTTMMVPTFLVWGIFWKPFGMILAVVWAWVSAAVYAGSRQMPCDLEEGDAATNVISIQESRSGDSKNLRADGKN